jgi:hypothetical protein
MAARQDDAASKSKRKTEEEGSSLDQKAVETAALADVEVWSDSDEDDPVIRNLNVMSKRNLMTPEWIENRKRLHYECYAHRQRVRRPGEGRDRVRLF